MANIVAADVQNRLRTLTSTDVTSTLLATTPYIPAADAWLNQILSNSSLSAFGDLSSDKQALCKAAEAAWCAAKVIASAPLRASRAGPIDIKPILAEDKKFMIDILRAEWTEYLTLVGASATAGYYTFDLAGGPDHMPEDTDATQIDYVSDDTFSVWSRDPND